MILLVMSLPLSAQKEEIRENLERVYHNWRMAMRDKDYAKWAETTAAFRKAEIRNAIVSQGRKFPDALFDVPLAPPEIRNLKLLDVRAVGFTANLIFFGQRILGKSMTWMELSVQYRFYWRTQA